MHENPLDAPSQTPETTKPSLPYARVMRLSDIPDAVALDQKWFKEYGVSAETLESFVTSENRNRGALVLISQDRLLGFATYSVLHGKMPEEYKGEPLTSPSVFFIEQFTTSQNYSENMMQDRLLLTALEGEARELSCDTVAEALDSHHAFSEEKTKDQEVVHHAFEFYTRERYHADSAHPWVWVGDGMQDPVGCTVYTKKLHDIDFDTQDVDMQQYHFPARITRDTFTSALIQSFAKSRGEVLRQALYFAYIFEQTGSDFSSISLDFMRGRVWSALTPKEQDLFYDAFDPVEKHRTEPNVIESAYEEMHSDPSDALQIQLRAMNDYVMGDEEDIQLFHNSIRYLEEKAGKALSFIDPETFLRLLARFSTQDLDDFSDGSVT